MDQPGLENPRPQVPSRGFLGLFTSCFQHQNVKQELSNEGLASFHQPADHDITIVAIHGLGGHRESTWKHKSGNLWLKDNLPSTDEFQNARIYSFGYDANLVGSQSVATIRQIANSLNQSLIDMQDTKPLIFVCHSLGGIIAKSAIIQSKGKTTEESQNLYQRVRGILFFGTPHQGSKEADLGTIAANTLNVLPFLPVNKKLIKSIKRDKGGLSEISEDFVNSLRDGHLFVVCFYETKMMYNRTIVIQNSAVLTLPANQQTQIASTADHSELVKFCDDQDPRYKQALAQLCDVRKRALALTTRGFRKVDFKQEIELLRALHDTGGDYEKSLDGLSTKRCENTGGWISNEQHLKDWGSQKDPAIALWLKGGVGVGKSVSLATLVSHLRSDAKKMTLYHFCSGGQIKPNEVFASILHQLLLKEPDLLPYVYWEYFHGQKFHTFSSVFASALSLTRFKEVFIVLDALDECDDPDNGIIKTLSRLTLPENSFLKILISSRPDKSIIGVYLDSAPIKSGTIELRASLVKQDIDTYITKELNSVLSRSLSKEDISWAGSVIKQKSENNWLLTHLVVKDIQAWGGRWTKNRLYDVISKLEAFTGGLYELYDKILDKIPLDARPDATKLFKWLIIARKPLSIKEASIALGLNTAHSSLEMLQGDIDRDMGADKLRNLCGPLIRVDESIGRVTLLHYSVKEYLTDIAGPRADRWWKIALQDASKQITRDCITFLSFREFSSSIPHPQDHYRPYTYDTSPAEHPDNTYENDHCSLRNLPFLKYAVTEWANHFKSCEEDLLSDPDCKQILEAFLMKKEKNVEFCFRLYQYFGKPGSFPETVSSLQLVCYFGLEKLVPLVVPEPTAAQGRRDIAMAEQGYSPLEMGARGGHISVVEQLLKLQHARNNRDAKAALSIAVDYGHTAIVECLLHHFPSFDSLSPQLESASVGGRTDIAELLLKMGADVKQGVKYSCPLEAAAYHGHLDMVKLLIEWKADINFFDNSSTHGYGAALHSAAAGNHLEIVEELLKSGADINLISGVHGTALQAAAHSGSIGVIRRLLVNNAVDQQCGQYGSALQAAKTFGYDDIAQLLGDAGRTPFDRLPVARTATLDDLATRRVDVFTEEAERGRIHGVEQEAARVFQNLMRAIERKNSRSVDFLLSFAVRGFQAAVRFGNENILESFSLLAGRFLGKMILLQHSDETRRISRAWAKALVWTVREGDRPNIARRMLGLGSEILQRHVDEGRYEDAEECVFIGLELFFAVAETENPKLLGIFLDLIISNMEQLLDGPFKNQTLRIVDGYTTKFRAALLQRNSKKEGARARALAIAGLLGLRTAIENKNIHVTQNLTTIWKELLDWIFDSGQAADILCQLESHDIPVSSGMDICVSEEILLLGACLLQMETTDQNWRITFRELVSTVIIRILNVAENARKFDVIEAHMESWAKGILRARPGGSTREDIRYVFEVARDESVPQASATLKMSLERIIKRIDEISEVGT